MVSKQSHYQAYSLATRTVPKTRQVVMLYDGAIRFLKQAIIALEEKRIEDRFNLLLKASKIINGLQGSIDFEKGGDVANTLFRYYTDMSIRILSVNLKPQESKKNCESIIEELKQMRDVWDNIDRTLDTTGTDVPPASQPLNVPVAAEVNVTLSA